MGLFSRWGWALLLLAACSGGSFVPLERPPEGWAAWELAGVGPDLLVRCKASLSGPKLQQSGDCRLWVGERGLRLEVSHPLAGMVLFAELEGEKGFWIEGETGQRSEFERQNPPLPWLGLEPLELKALLLGRSLVGHPVLAGAERPQTRRFGSGELVVSYPLWFKLQGLELPKVIEWTSGEDRLKLVILELHWGSGEALALP